MAKKTASKKKKKKASSASKSKKPARRASTGKKKSKSAGGTKKSAGRKTAKKSTGTKKKAARASTAKKEKAAKGAKRGGSTKKSAGKAGSKKAGSGKSESRKPGAKKSVATKTTAKKAAATAKAEEPVAAKTAGDADAKGDRKGITVVAKKTPRRPRNPPAGSFMMPSSGMAGFGAALGKPLIPSGPAAPDQLDAGANEAGGGGRKKTPFTKRELTKFRKILVAKREELSGEVSELENEALGRGAAEQRSKSQAVDDQGSEAADQAIGLDLVAAERRLLSEIVEAIRRIDDGTYGLCEVTGRAINKERLEELPWTRYSIDAARQLERRSLGS